jgi:3-oxoacyl-[acyl-carrier protein] reductase
VPRGIARERCGDHREHRRHCRGIPAHLHNPLLERRAKPEDVAAVVRLLAGPRGRSITGQDWHVNAGGYLG